MNGMENAPLLLDEPIGTFHVVRSLSESDVKMLAHDSPGLLPIPQRLVRIRHTHHRLARLIADGHKGIECSELTGFSQSTISRLQSDPAFQELVAYYHGQKEAVYVDVHQRLADVGMLALEELKDRLEETPEKFQIGQLREIVESTFDRSVAPAKGGPKSQGGNSGVTVNVQFVEPEKGQIIDVKPNVESRD